jgi:hypothetical protein
MHYLTSKVADSSLYQTVFDDGYVVWSPLPWSEYKKLREARLIRGPSIDIDLEEFVYNKSVVFSSYDEVPPPEFELEDKMLFIEDNRLDQPAGVVSTVVKAILYFSGALRADSIIQQLDQYRGSIDNIEDQLTVAICRAFPAYKPEDIEKMEWQTVLKRAAQAEAALMGRMIEPPFRIVTEEDIQKEQRKHRFDLQKEIREVGKEWNDIQDPRQFEREAQEAQRERQQQQSQLREQFMRQRGQR